MFSEQAHPLNPKAENLSNWKCYLATSKISLVASPGRDCY